MDNRRDLFPSEQFATIVRDLEPYMTDGQQDDRRVQRSKQLLQQALVSLISEKRFAKITVQEIIERANVGRTTFYAHFQSKEDLFLSSHSQIVDMISRSFFTEDGAWRSEPSPELIAFLKTIDHRRDVYFFLSWRDETGGVIRLLKERIAENLAARLHELFREEDSSIPFVVLAQHVAGSMVALIGWWMDRRTAYTLQDIATMAHQMNRVVLRSALEKKVPGG